MRKVKIPLDDLLTVLQAMKDNGTTEIMFFEYNGYPALTDYDDQENVITFASVNEKGEVDEDEQIH